MRWPLRTTETGTLQNDIDRVLEGEKNFLWRHYVSEEDKASAVSFVSASKLLVLHAVPCWFLVACREDVPANLQFRLLHSIYTGLSLEEPIWRGVQFGYPEEDISWYVTEIQAAKQRLWAWVEENLRATAD